MTTRSSQPVRAPTGLDYGERQKITNAQQAVPLPDNRSQPPAGGGAQGAPGGGGPGGAPVPDVYGPTDRPNEPATAGAALGAGPQNLGVLPPDPVAHIRALYDQYPHEDLRRLLERASESRVGAASASPTSRPQPPALRRPGRTSQPTQAPPAPGRTPTAPAQSSPGPEPPIGESP